MHAPPLVRLLLFVAMMPASLAAPRVPLLEETFASSGAFTMTTPFFSSGASAYLGLYTSPTGANNFGTGSTPSNVGAFTGLSAPFLVTWPIAQQAPCA
jgi:hypothetical protein